MLIRIVEKDDLPQLLNLYHQLNESDPALSDNRIDEIWTQFTACACCKCFVVIEHDSIIASCTITIIPNFTRGGRSYGVIENMITDFRYRNKGIGTLLINHIVNYARTANCYKVMLQSGNGRKDAHFFYEKAGFDSTSKKAFEMRF